MLQDKYLNKLRELPEPVRQFGGLVTITGIVILSFAILNIFWGGGDELIRKMKLEEERIAQEKELNELVTSLPSGILVSFEGTDYHKMSEEQYETVCNATKIVSQRSVMGVNLTNFKAKEIYTINGNQIDETFVKWDKAKNKCFAGFVLICYSCESIDGGEKPTITVRGEALSFFNTGIDTRVYFIKNF